MIIVRASRCRYPLLLLHTLASSLAACGEARSIDGLLVRDSLGIEVVEHGRLGVEPGLAFGPPLLRIDGTAAGYQFSRIVAGTILSDGRAVIGDIETAEVVIVGLDGRVETVLGGRGSGPGEIQTLVGVSALAGDTIVVEDDGNTRLSYFHGDSLVRTVQLRDRWSAMTDVALGLWDGHWVTITRSYGPHFDLPWLESPIVLLRTDGVQRDTVGWFDFRRRLPSRGAPNPFRPQGHATLAPPYVVLVRTDRAELRLFDLASRRIQRIVRWSEPTEVLTDSTWATYRNWVLTRTPAAAHTYLIDDLRARRVAAEQEPLPFIGTVLADKCGRIWVSDFTPSFQHPSRYRIFSPTGAWVGSVAAPRRTQFLDLTHDRVLAIQRDSLGLEGVVIFPSPTGLPSC